MNLRNDIARQKQSIDAYIQFVDNKFDKYALEDKLALIKG